MAKKKEQHINTATIVKLVTSLALMFFLMFCISKRLSTQLTDVVINVEKTAKTKLLIDKKQIRAKLRDELGYDIGISNTGQLDIYKLEKFLEADSRINTANIYIDKHNVIYINVKQKKPIVRIEVTGGKDYYLDYQGERIPVTETFHVPVVTGEVDAYSSNYQAQKNHNLNDVLAVARQTYDNDFLNGLISQINVDKNDELTLVPKLGRGIIQLGHVENLDEKIYKLKVYYANGLKNIGIDKFDELDLRYKGQVIPRNLQS